MEHSERIIVGIGAAACISISIVSVLVMAIPEPYLALLIGIGLATGLFSYFTTYYLLRPRIIQIAEVDGKIFALRSDGTIWRKNKFKEGVPGPFWKELHEHPPLK